MKKIRIQFTLAIILAIGLFTSCQSSATKVEEAKEDVAEAKEDLKEAIKDTITEAEQAVFAAEWKTFKAETELTIKGNETRIAELRKQMKASGKKMDATYEKKIDTLQMLNNDLEAKMNMYNGNKTDWAMFKSEFSSDMNKLGKALKDFTIDNK